MKSCQVRSVQAMEVKVIGGDLIDGAVDDVDRILDVIRAVQVEVFLEIVREFEKELRDRANGRLLPIGHLADHESGGCGDDHSGHEATVRAIERGSGLARLILLADRLRAVVERPDDVQVRD